MRILYDIDDDDFYDQDKGGRKLNAYINIDLEED